ncbi:beta-mannosidase [Chondrinema litorale]|uniref:beta-mannosidase n=1 Tax=Chondrinema litorale TaxID=2994555 RepID=UPI002543A3CA|nr:glycoside hydrolase family 2 protein [Chondrinema litorale]UZR98358.1 hypothetical protein OQ292_30635 [Chondrinema litorale]
MKALKIILVFITFLYFAACNQVQNQNNTDKTLELNSNWVFKKTSDKSWTSATVPGSVHTDLINNHVIEDPFYRLNELDLQWIDKEDWEYKTTFELSKEDLNWQQIELEFDGLDTYAKVSLNGSQILETDNMFRNYATNVKSLLKEGNNELSILFESPIQKGIEKYDALGYKIPVSDNDLAKIGQVEGEKQVSIFTRKAGYHFGWDWGPRLVTSGIWKPIKLKSWNSYIIRDVFIEQTKLDEQANLTAWIDLEASNDIDKTAVEILVEGQSIKSEEVKISKGLNKLKIPFTISEPKLWWPNGLGEQNLYNVKVNVSANNLVSSSTKRIGLRNIEIVREPDAVGTTFYFKVNGQPVFMKGVNYIPQDVFLDRVTKDHYESVLNSAKEANMNMLRIWGGGIYEKDVFYDLCDEKGLLVWQDFMFACAMFPGDQAFLDNVKQEAIDNVKRLRNHTSIALWCGNNEILSAWENWGWKKKVNEEQSEEVADKIWTAYDNIFHKILPDVVKEYDGSKFYWASSPSSDLGVKESLIMGDAHYWMVWWGKEKFETYNDAIPRFMSEFGFQSFPEYSSVLKYTMPEDHDIYSDVMQSHQRSNIGNVTIDEYMKRHYKKPKDFENFLYVSHLLQAYGIRIGIEAHRKKMHDYRCMGSLYWQINDCWPVASWSSIDYYGKWKALHYAVKKSFKTTLISFEEREDNIAIYIASDSLNEINGKLKVEIIDYEGKELKSWSNDVNISANDANIYFEIPNSELEAFEADKIVINASLISGEQVLSEKLHYLKPFKDLALIDPEISYSVKENGDYFDVTVSSNKLALGVYIASNSSGNFSDNYFDLLPNSEKVISIKKENIQDLSSFEKELKVYSLYTSY